MDFYLGCHSEEYLKPILKVGCSKEISARLGVDMWNTTHSSFQDTEWKAQSALFMFMQARSRGDEQDETDMDLTAKHFQFSNNSQKARDFS